MCNDWLPPSRMNLIIVNWCTCFMTISSVMRPTCQTGRSCMVIQTVCPKTKGKYFHSSLWDVLISWSVITNFNYSDTHKSLHDNGLYCEWKKFMELPLIYTIINVIGIVKTGHVYSSLLKDLYLVTGIECFALKSQINSN